MVAAAMHLLAAASEAVEDDDDRLLAGSRVGWSAGGDGQSPVQRHGAGQSFDATPQCAID